MIADYDNVPMMFSECNIKYFKGKLPTPRFTIISKSNILARFEYNKDKKGKHPIKWQELKFTDFFDFDEHIFREIMVHELIHYYIAWNGIRDNGEHGDEFMKIAREFKDKYGLEITKTKDASSFKRTEKASKSRGFLSMLFG